MAEERDDEQLPEEGITNFEFAAMFLLAVIKDVVDILLLTAAGVGLVLNRITNIFVVGCLWLWIFYRFHRFPTKRFVTGAVAEFIPVVGEFPCWSAFVLILWVQTKTSIGKASLKKSVQKFSQRKEEQVAARLSSRSNKKREQRSSFQKTTSPRPKLYSPETIRGNQVGAETGRKMI